MKRLTILILISLLFACASSVDDIDYGDKTSKEIFEERFSGVSQDSISVIKPRVSHHDAITRDAVNEIHNLFPKAPNPELVIYLYPHFNVYGLIIPGYSVPFKMYKEDHYLLNDNSER